jgi:hypothetical protein
MPVKAGCTAVFPDGKEKNPRDDAPRTDPVNICGSAYGGEDDEGDAYDDGVEQEDTFASDDERGNGAEEGMPDLRRRASGLCMSTHQVWVYYTTRVIPLAVQQSTDPWEAG